MKLRTLSVTALAVVAVGAAHAQIFGSVVGGKQIAFELDTIGQLVTTDNVLQLTNLTGSRVATSFTGTYNDTANGSGANSSFSGSFNTGTLRWDASGSAAFLAETGLSTLDTYCLTPTEPLSRTASYIVVRAKSYSGIQGTPPPAGAGFIPGTFSAFNAARILTSTYSANAAVNGAIRQSLIWDLAMSGGNGVNAALRGMSTVNGGTANAVGTGWSAEKANAFANAYADNNSSRSFLLYVPVVPSQDGTKWVFDTNSTVNPASQVFISADPVPEPATLALGAAGFLAALRRRRARRS